MGALAKTSNVLNAKTNDCQVEDCTSSLISLSKSQDIPESQMDGRTDKIDEHNAKGDLLD